MTNTVKKIKEPRVLKGYKGLVSAVAITPDGKWVVSGSWDKTLRVWDLESGQNIATFKGHEYEVEGVAVTPDGKQVVSGSRDNTLKIWDLRSGLCTATLKGHLETVYKVVPTPDGKRLVSCSDDATLKVWDLATQKCLTTLRGHKAPIGRSAVAVTTNGKRVVSGSLDRTLKVWDMESGDCLITIKGHSNWVRAVAVTSDNKQVVSGSRDHTLKVWDLETGRNTATFEGHISEVNYLEITPDGKRVVSGSDDETMIAWDLETGQIIATFEGHEDWVCGLAITPDGRRVVSASADRTIRVWDLPEPDAVGEPSLSSRYTNAKVVLVGESGVGKTGLAIRLAEDRWEKTDSTHGMEVRRLELPEVNAEGMDREILLWDFAGQPDYRLIHQLYMDDTALALLLIDPQRDNPFESLPHWEKALAAAVKHNPAKLLVSARCDRGGITVSSSKLQQYGQSKNYGAYIDTAAKTGTGCEDLKALIAAHIPWDRLPWTATTTLFKTLKEAIINIKKDDIVLMRISELHRRLQTDSDEPIDPKGLRGVVGLTAGQGLVKKIDFGDYLLMQPEQINNYASAVVRCVRDNIDEIGCIPEHDVLEAAFDFKDMRRLETTDEKILLRAMLQTFIDRSLCLRENTPRGTQLVFPSYFRQDFPEVIEHPHVWVTYNFRGMPAQIYTTLVVRLYYTHGFTKDQFWKDAVDFKTPGGKRVGLQMFDNTGDGAKIKVYFEQGVPVDTQVTFIKYIHEHLEKRAKEVTRVRSYTCPHCNIPQDNYKAIKRRVDKGKKDIICTDCEKRVPLMDLIEEKFASDEFLQKVREMDARAQINLDNESKELILVGQAITIAAEAGQIFRPTPNSDWGIDGEIEFKDNNGEASGERLYLQLKSGDSYLESRKDDRRIFRLKNARHTSYWQKQAYPVMLVIRTVLVQRELEISNTCFSYLAAVNVLKKV